MRIRSSAASIAALVVTAGLLAGCTAAAPEADPPAASTPAPEPTPSAAPAAAPDLAALCEQLLPLATVQERFGEESELLTGREDTRPDISAWGGLLRGRINCGWGTTQDRNVAVTLQRGDNSFFTTMRDSVEDAPATPRGGDWRYDAFGTSVDACETVYWSCQYSLLLGEQDDWLEIDLRADHGSTLLPAEEMRARWDPEVQRIIDAADELLNGLPEPVAPSPDCESLLSDAEASALIGTDVQATEPGFFFHDMTLLGAGGPTLRDVDHCLWADYNAGVSVLMTQDPQDLRASAFATVEERIDGAGSGEQLEIAGADDAWRSCITSDSGSDCVVDLRVGDLWMSVRVDGADAETVASAAEQMLAKLAA